MNIVVYLLFKSHYTQEGINLKCVRTTHRQANKQL